MIPSEKKEITMMVSSTGNLDDSILKLGPEEGLPGLSCHRAEMIHFVQSSIRVAFSDIPLLGESAVRAVGHQAAPKFG